MKNIFQVVLLLAGTIIALLMAHIFNIFNYMPFVPIDKKYDVCIAAYFTLVETIINNLVNFIYAKVSKNRTFIKVTLYNLQEVPNPNSIPKIYFNNMGIAKMGMKLSIKGRFRNIREKKVIINHFLHADMQFDRRGTGATIDNEGNLLIDLNKFNQNDKVIECEENYIIVFQRSITENSAEILIRPSIEKTPNSFFLNFNENAAKLIMEEK
jgi:hypothetical protein